MYKTFHDPPPLPSRLTRSVWRQYEHLAQVSRSAAIHRVKKGWDVFAAITTPHSNADRTEKILEFLSSHPLSTRDQIAKGVGCHRTAIYEYMKTLQAEGKVYKSIGKTSKNRPVYFWSLSSIPDIPLEDEEDWTPKPFINPIRRRIL